MTVYVLLYVVGVSSGYEELIGIYDSMEALEQGKKKDKKEYDICRLDDSNYQIKEIEINKNINTIYCEW